MQFWTWYSRKGWKVILAVAAGLGFFAPWFYVAIREPIVVSAHTSGMLSLLVMALVVMVFALTAVVGGKHGIKMVSPVVVLAVLLAYGPTRFEKVRLHDGEIVATKRGVWYQKEYAVRVLAARADSYKVYVSHADVSDHGARLEYTLSKDVVSAWNHSERSMHDGPREALRTFVSRVAAMEPRTRRELLKARPGMVMEMLCALTRENMQLKTCPYERMSFDIPRGEASTPIWSTRIPTQEIIQDRLGEDAYERLMELENHADLTATQINLLVQVYLGDGPSAENLRRIIASVPQITDATRSKIWEAFGKLDNAACYALDMIEATPGLTDQERFQLVYIAKSTKNGECAQLVLDRTKDRDPELTHTERMDLRRQVVRGKNFAMAEKLFDEGLAIDEVEYAVWLDGALNGDINDAINALGEMQSGKKVSAEDRSQIIQRLSVFTRDNLRGDMLQILSLLESEALTSAERQTVKQGFWSAAKEGQGFVFVELARQLPWTNGRVNINTLETVFSMVRDDAIDPQMVVQILANIGTESIRIGTYMPVVNLLYDAVLERKNPAACARALRVPFRDQRGKELFKLASARYKGLMACAKGK